MATLFHYIGLTCIIFLVLPQMVNGINCYLCTLCDTVSSSTVTQNSSAFTACYKTVYSAGGVSGVVRGGTANCAAGSTTYNGASGTQYCCTTDLCNGGITLSSSFILALAIAIVGSIVRITMNN